MQDGDHDIRLTENTTSDDRMELERKLEYEKEVNKDLVKKIGDQIFITKKTEVAFNTQTELVNAKNEIIENHKFIIEQLRKETSARELTQNLTSHLNSNVAGIDNKNGVKENCEFIEVHGKNGAILNGLLLWADIQRKVTPENIWKTQALKKITDDEITQAKETLWRISGESVIGKISKRQGPNKTQAELNDICSALKLLSDKNNVPLFLGTSDIVAQTPIYLIPNTYLIPTQYT